MSPKAKSKAAIRPPRPALLGLPVLLVAAFWVGLWLAWPMKVEPPSRGKRPLSPRVVYTRTSASENGGLHHTPILFALPTRVGFSPLDEGVVLETEVASPRLSPRYLGPSIAPGTPQRERPVAARAALHDTSYCVPCAPTTAYGAMDSGDWRVVARPSVSLLNSGFECLRIASLSETELGAAWDFSAWIQFDEEGAAQYAFVERGSGDPHRDMRLVRLLEQSTVETTDTPVYGLVTLSADRPRRAVATREEQETP